MKTKYEKFFEQVLHSFDEPKKYYPLHAKVGFVKPEHLRQQKFKMMSATKIFLSNDFIYKDYYTWKEKRNKKTLGKYYDHKKDEEIINKKRYEKTQKAMAKEVVRRKEMGLGLHFMDALPIYDDCVIIFPRKDIWHVGSDFTSPRFEFMNLIWINKLNKQDRLSVYNYDSDRINESIVGKNEVYNISAFDNFESCGREIMQNLLNKDKINDKNVLEDFKNRTSDHPTPWLRTEIFPYIVNFDGDNLFPSSPIDSFKQMFPHHPIEVRKELEKFTKFSVSPLCLNTTLSDEFIIDYLEGHKFDPHKPFMRLGNIITILAFINKKGQETPTFSASMPVKKRSKIQKQFEYKMLEVKKANRITTRFGDSINKNRLHQVRGHMRHYQSGKKTWIKSYERGDEKMGIIIKDYNFK